MPDPIPSKNRSLSASQGSEIRKVSFSVVPGDEDHSSTQPNNRPFSENLLRRLKARAARECMDGSYVAVEVGTTELIREQSKLQPGLFGNPVFWLVRKAHTGHDAVIACDVTIDGNENRSLNETVHITLTGCKQDREIALIKGVGPDNPENEFQRRVRQWIEDFCKSLSPGCAVQAFEDSENLFVAHIKDRSEEELGLHVKRVAFTKQAGVRSYFRDFLVRPLALTIDKLNLRGSQTEFSLEASFSIDPRQSRLNSSFQFLAQDSRSSEALSAVLEVARKRVGRFLSTLPGNLVHPFDTEVQALIHRYFDSLIDLRSHYGIATCKPTVQLIVTKEDPRRAEAADYLSKISKTLNEENLSRATEDTEALDAPQKVVDIYNTIDTAHTALGAGRNQASQQQRLAELEACILLFVESTDTVGFLPGEASSTPES